MRLHSLLRPFIACVLTLAALSAARPAPAQSVVYPGTYAYPQTYRYPSYWRGGGSSRPYSPYSYSQSKRLFQRRTQGYWPTGRGVPVAKPWIR